MMAADCRGARHPAVLLSGSSDGNEIGALAARPVLTGLPVGGFNGTLSGARR